MSFMIQGQVHNVFEAPGGKDKKTGTEYPSTWKLQLISPVQLRNGSVKDELFTMTIPGGPKAATDLKEAKGQEVTLPCGIFASGGKIQTFLLDL